MCFSVSKEDGRGNRWKPPLELDGVGQRQDRQRPARPAANVQDKANKKVSKARRATEASFKIIKVSVPPSEAAVPPDGDYKLRFMNDNRAIIMLFCAGCAKRQVMNLQYHAWGGNRNDATQQKKHISQRADKFIELFKLNGVDTVLQIKKDLLQGNTVDINGEEMFLSSAAD